LPKLLVVTEQAALARPSRSASSRISDAGVPHSAEAFSGV
jgi:hypothetical protein